MHNFQNQLSMSEALALPEKRGAAEPTLRHLKVVFYRQLPLALTIFFSVVLAAVLAGFVFPSYRSEVRILINRERLNPIVSAQESVPPQFAVQALTEAEVNSEMELLKAEDSLRSVVITTGLADPKSSWINRIFPESNPEKRIQAAIRKLRNKLEIEPIRKANLISVSYTSRDAEKSAAVMSAVIEEYLKKNVAMHRPPGQVAFFEQRTEEYQKQLNDAESELNQFNQRRGIAAPLLERDTAVQRLAEFESEREKLQADIAQNQGRANMLSQELKTAPNRITTQVRTADNPQLMQDLRSTLLKLQLQRSELLSKYAPTYRPVQEVEQQIAQANAAIAAAEAKPLKDVTSDRDATYEWIRSELAKTKSEGNSLSRRITAIDKSVSSYQALTSKLSEAQIEQQGLLRKVKTAEDSYLLYKKKTEEARINDQLDQHGMMNAALVDPPTVPRLPVVSPIIYLAGGMLLGLLLAAAAAFVADRLDDTFRTPEEVSDVLGLPLVAVFPLRSERISLRARSEVS